MASVVCALPYVVQSQYGKRNRGAMIYTMLMVSTGPRRSVGKGSTLPSKDRSGIALLGRGSPRQNNRHRG